MERRLVPACAAALLAVPCGAAASQAAEPALLPGPETGFIAAAGGWRLVPQGGLELTASRAGMHLVGHPGQPAFQVPLSFRVDRAWVLGIEGGWSRDRLDFGSGGALEFQTVNLLFSVQRVFDLGWRRLEPYLGGGIGYFLSTVERSGTGSETGTEANATGVFLCAGLRLALSAGVGLLLEDRFAFASVALDDLGGASVGGNTVLLGLWAGWPGGGRE